MGQVSQAIEMCYREMGISQYGFIKTNQLIQEGKLQDSKAHLNAKEKIEDFESIFVFTTESAITEEMDVEEAYAAYRKARQQTIRFFHQFFKEQVIVLSCKSADHKPQSVADTRLSYKTFEECEINKEKLAEIAGVSVVNTEDHVTCLGCLFF